ncbi:hypothetical protein D3C72_1513390 [compost metagenome]
MGFTGLFHRHEFKEYTVVKEQQHAILTISGILCGKEAFGSIVGLEVMHILMWNQLFKLVLVRLEAYPAVNIQLQVRPYLTDIGLTGLFENTFE